VVITNFGARSLQVRGVEDIQRVVDTQSDFRRISFAPNEVVKGAVYGLVSCTPLCAQISFHGIYEPHRRRMTMRPRSISYQNLHFNLSALWYSFMDCQRSRQLFDLSCSRVQLRRSFSLHAVFQVCLHGAFTNLQCNRNFSMNVARRN
jgi:hypothetical protein